MTVGQNKSHAVMAQRFEHMASLDNFPTPPWATRALVEHVLGSGVGGLSCLEPACGAGHMAKVLREYFLKVDASDIADYGFGGASDFMASNYLDESYDWVITNPPFNLAEEFFYRAIRISKRGVCLLTRTVFIESVGRYNRLFSKYPPAYFAQFVERVPMVKGRLDKRATTATGYSWLIWDKAYDGVPQLVWIPPCRRSLEKMGDYPGDFDGDMFALIDC